MWPLIGATFGFAFLFVAVLLLCRKSALRAAQIEALRAEIRAKAYADEIVKHNANLCDADFDKWVRDRRKK